MQVYFLWPWKVGEKMIKEKRSIWDKVFGSYEKPVRNEEYLQFTGGYIPSFTPFGTDPYSSDIVRSSIHAIASNGAKLKPKHITRVEGKVSYTKSNIEQLLTVKPNPFMSAYDLIYKIITQLYLQNNSFVFIHNDKYGDVEGFYPVDFSSVDILEANEELYVRFRFPNGKQMTAPYSQFIHLRRFFAKSDMFGETNDDALLPTLELIKTTDEGIANAVKSSAFLRGLIKYQGMLKDGDLKANRDRFVTDYMDVTNNGGIAALDSKAEYQELKNDPKMIDSKQMELIKQKVYEYFNINSSIVTSSYDENQWNAFYESVLEPLAIQFSQEFTAKLFTENEKKQGNEIIFEANRLQYASNTTKIAMVRDLMPLGILSKNEAREIFNLSSIEGGDEFIQTLNVVNANLADQYQMDNSAPKGGDKDDNPG